jgi:hypothetical protein
LLPRREPAPALPRALKALSDFVQTIRAMGGEWAGREHEVEFELSRGRAVELLAERERHVFNEQKER